MSLHPGQLNKPHKIFRENTILEFEKSQGIYSITYQIWRLYLNLLQQCQKWARFYHSVPFKIFTGEIQKNKNILNLMQRIITGKAVMEDVTDPSHEPMLDHHQSNNLTGVTLVIKFHKKYTKHRWLLILFCKHIWIKYSLILKIGWTAWSSKIN